ncbi:Bromodomain-containing protein [Parasitella parasitica]|nr:Bromodomain-containing protein [Parasitella parasitica]
MTPAERNWCLQTIKSLRKHKRAIAFLEPVDPIVFKIPDYFDIIKSPMDLGTIDKKLKAEQYPTLAAFKADVQLVFDNCFLYNNAGDPVTQDAKKLEEHYKKLCKKEPSLAHATEAPKKIVISAPKPTTYIDNTFSSEQFPTQQPQQDYSSTPSTALDVDTSSSSSSSSSMIPDQQTPKPRIKVKLPVQPDLYNETPKSATTMTTTTTTTTATATAPITAPAKSPSTDSTSLAVRNTHHGRMEAMPEDQFKRCEAIVHELKKPKYKGFYWPFLNPVDADAWGASDYYEIIKQPMDMTTYERKLYEYEYSNEEELAQDIRLMFRNCYFYNPPNHLVHGLGKEFEEIFEKQWAKLHSNNKKSSKSHSSKRRRTSHTVDTPTLNNTPPSTVQQPQPQTQSLQTTTTSFSESSLLKSDNSLSDIKINTNNNNQGRSTILRLKLNGPTVKKEEQPKPKPIVKVPGLALSKEPPSSAAITSVANGPKLAIGVKPPSPVKEKKPEKSTPIVLQNHDKWLALAKKSPTEAATAPAAPVAKAATQHKPTLQQTHHTNYNKKPKEIISPSASTPNLHHSPPPQPPQAPKAQPFDINVLYNQIHNEKKLKEQQKREEQDRWEKNEKIRLEKEKIATEIRLGKLRELNQQSQMQRQQDKKDRYRELNSQRIDISKQKMMFAKFESSFLVRDQDWREVFTWQRDTNDYRHIPVPGFVKRAPIKIPELRRRLLSKCARLENSKSNDHSPETVNGDGELSDMDVD